MSFTDDDLKRLKKHLEDLRHPSLTWGMPFNISALLARLEAAERACESDDCPHCPNQGWYEMPNAIVGVRQEQCQWCWETQTSRFNLTAVWRKAAGK